MRDDSTCPACGAPLAQGHRGGLCPACLLHVTLARWANWEHARAQRAERAVKEGLSQMRIREAEQYLAANDSATALAALAWELRDDPNNRIAAERLVSALTERNFPLPISPVVGHVHGPADDPWGPPGWPIAIRTAGFSPDGRLVLTASEDHTVRVWDAITLQPCSQPLKHSSRVRSARFSPDSNQVLTVAEDGVAAIWESEDDLTGQVLRKPLTQAEKINHAEFSPDGRWVLTASDDKTARLWDAHTGQPTGQRLSHRMGVQRAGFSPDGRFILTFAHWAYGSPEDSSFTEEERGRRLAERVTLWDAETSQPLSHPSAWQDARTIDFSPDGRRVLVVGRSAVTGIFDTLTGDPIQGFERPQHNGHDRFFAKLSPDGQRFVTVAEDATARLWDARTGKEVTEPLKHDQEVACAEFSPDGLRLVTVTEDSLARIWDAVTGELLSEPVGTDYCGHAHFSPDGERLLVAGCASIQVWDIRPGQTVIRNIPGFGRFSPTEADVMLANPPDGQCQTWNVRDMRPLSEPFGYAKCVPRNNGPFAYERVAHFSLDGRLVFTIEGNLVGIWDSHTGEPKQEPVQLEGVPDPLQSPQWIGPRVDPLRFLFSPDGSVIHATDGTELKSWDTRTGRIRARAPMNPRDGFRVSEVSSDGNLLAMQADCGPIRVWDAHTCKLVAEPYGYDGGSLLYQNWPSPDGAPEPFVGNQIVVSGRFSSDGKRLITAHADGSAWIWDARTGRVLTKLLKHAKRVNNARFSGDGNYVLTASDDKTARVWDSHTGEPLMPALKHHSAVEAAEFSRDGGRIVTAAKDHTVRLWDAQTGLALSEPRRHQGLWGDVEAGPDGNWLYLHAQGGGCWDTTPVPPSAPAWLPELAEAIAGFRLTPHRTAESVPEGSLLRLKEELAMQPEDDYYSRWLRWFFADRSSRTISPHSAAAMGTRTHRDSNPTLP